jgi:hypothetical protein
MDKKITKQEKIELEILAIQLWWEKFGKSGLSEEKHRLYMCEKLNILQEELNNLQKSALNKPSWV